MNEEQLNVNNKSSRTIANIVLFGDSMAKNIHTTKLTRAARSKVACPTLRGAKISQIKDVFQQSSDNYDNNKLHGIIIHLGTDDLVTGEPEEAAQKMEELIIAAKEKSSKIAVSSVVLCSAFKSSIL